MISSAIGYIICESDLEVSRTNIIDASSDKYHGKAIADCVLQTANEKNRNGRFYSREELFPQLTAPRTQELLKTGTLKAECGHPLSKDLQRQSTIDDTKTCARFLKLWTEGDDIRALAIGTNNEYGKAFDMDLKEDVLPAWSLRALGSIEQTRRGAEVKNLRVITWDNVIYPSHPGAYTKGLVNESAMTEADKKIKSRLQAVYESNNPFEDDKNGDIAIAAPIMKEDVVRFIKSESSNLKFVRECFDFAYNDITVSENGAKVILTANDGEVLVINLESYVFNQLLDYGSEYLPKTREERERESEQFYFEKFELGKKDKEESKEEEGYEWEDDDKDGLVSDEDFDKFCREPVREIVNKYAVAAKKVINEMNASSYTTVYSATSRYAIDEVKEDGIFDLVSYDIDGFKKANKDKFDKKLSDKDIEKAFMTQARAIVDKIEKSVTDTPKGVTFVGCKKDGDDWDECDSVIKFSSGYLKSLIKK